jgi:hypothetical protein
MSHSEYPQEVVEKALTEATTTLTYIAYGENPDDPRYQASQSLKKINEIFSNADDD